MSAMQTDGDDAIVLALRSGFATNRARGLRFEVVNAETPI
jgi:hypothetical protein